jgi:hypothetical protein
LNNFVYLDDNGSLYPEIGDNWAVRPAVKGDFVRQTAGIDAINAANRVLNADMTASLKKVLLNCLIAASAIASAKPRGFEASGNALN